MSEPWTNDPVVKPAAPMPWDNDPVVSSGFVDRFKAKWDEVAARPKYPEVYSFAKDRSVELAKASDAPMAIMWDGDEGQIREQDRDEFVRMRNVVKGMTWAQDDEAKKDIIAANLPGATFEEGPEESVIVHWNGQSFYLNKPGISGQDLAEYGAMGGMAAALAPVGGGVGGALLGGTGRVLGTGLFLGGQSVGQDMIARQAGSEQPIDLLRAATMGALGSTFELFGPMFSRLLQKAFPSGRGFFEGRGLSSKGKEFVRKMGISPDDLTPEQITAFKQFYGTTDDAAAAMRQAEAGALPVPDTLTTGQATQSPWLQTAESGFKQGPGGEILLNKQAQQTAIGQANKQAIQGQIGGGLAPGQGAGNARDWLLAKQAADKASIKAAYKAAEGKTASLGGANFGNFVQRLRSGIEAKYPGKYFGSLKGLLDDLETIGAKGTADLRALEQWRTQAGKVAQGLVKNNPSEANGIRTAIGETDKWLGNSFSVGAVSGDQTALQTWRNAITKRREFGQLFERTDIVKKLTQQRGGGVTELKVDYDDAVNAIFGKSGLGNKSGLASDLKALKEVLPEQEWSGLRQEAFLRLFRNQGEVLDGTRFAKELDNALLDNREAMLTLFTPQEIGTLQQFKRYLVTVTSPAKIVGKVNTSNTAVTNYFFRQLGSLGRATQAFIQSMFAGGQNTWNAPAAAKMARGLLPPRASVLPPGVTGAVGSEITTPEVPLP